MERSPFTTSDIFADMTIGVIGLLICGILLIANFNQHYCVSRAVFEVLSFKAIESHDHWTPDMQFPIGGPLKPSLYLAPLLRYCVSNT